MCDVLATAGIYPHTGDQTGSLPLEWDGNESLPVRTRFAPIIQYVSRVIFSDLPKTSEIEVNYDKINDYEKLFDRLDRAYMGSEKINQKIDFLSKIYVFRNSGDVYDFLGDKRQIVGLVAEARYKIREYFPHEELFLDIITYPDSIGENKLVINISTKLSPDEAISKLDMFDENWWIDASECYDTELCIQVEYK